MFVVFLPKSKVRGRKLVLPVMSLLLLHTVDEQTIQLPGCNHTLLYIKPLEDDNGGGDGESDGGGDDDDDDDEEEDEEEEEEQ